MQRERYLIGLAAAAHDIGRPLSTMSVLVDDLRRAGAPPPDWRDAIEVLWSQLLSCRRSLADLAKAADVECSGEPRSIGAKEFVLEVARRFESTRPEVDLKRWIVRLKDPFPVDNDPTLAQAVLSFLHNAADASPRSVELRVLQKDERLCIQVLDRGGGIAPQVRSRIGKRPVSTKPGGCGLGMLIARFTVERYGSSIRIFDRRQGGTCVQIELPRFRADCRQPHRETHELRIAAG
jgi:two-component system sensor histidine kinase RegB